MSEDINKKIKQITDILGQENLPDNLKNIINLFSASQENENTERGNSKPASSEESAAKNLSVLPPKEEKGPSSDMEENLEMVRKIKRIVEGINSNNDPRVNLLNAMRPFLSNTRQNKIGNCIKMLQMISLSKLMDDNEKISF